MIHSTAIVSNRATIGKNVSIGPYTIIHDNVHVGDNTEIGSHCELGISTSLASSDGLTIGQDSVIRSHSVFYSGSIFGDGLVTGHRVTVRENTNAGLNLQIGTLSDIQGHCTIGNYVRFHSNVHIGQKSVIEDFVWIFPYVVLTNDPHPPSEVLMGVTVKKYAVVATMSVVLPGVTVASGTLVGAHTLVNEDTEENFVYTGNPMKKIVPTSKIKNRLTKDNVYPWPSKFHRGYPEEVINQWLEEYGK